MLFRRSARIDCLAVPLIIRLNQCQVVALETAGSGITCNAVCPGWVLTPLVQKQIETRAAQADIRCVVEWNPLPSLIVIEKALLFLF